MIHVRVLRALAAGLALGAALAGAQAQNVFSMTGVGGSTTVTTGSDHELDLVDDAINTRNAFAGLAGSAAVFSLNYGGVPNAIIISKNAAGTQATLTLGPTGVTRTFNGANQSDLQQQIDNYLKRDGRDDLKDFFKAMNRLSKVAVSDGNPNATTARTADFSYNRFGFNGESIGVYRLTPEGKRDGIGLQLDFGVSAGGFDAGDLSGGSLTGTVAANYFFNKHVGLSIGSFVSFESIEDAEVFHLGTTFGTALRPVVKEGKTGVLWQVTPFVSGSIGASEDMVAGGSLGGIGVTNLLSWSPTEKFTIAMANQISHYSGGELEFGSDSEFNLDSNVNQTIVKNGLRGAYQFNDTWSMYAGVTVTDFLNDAAVSDWWSPEIGFTITTDRKGGGFLVGFTGDLGPDYSGFGGRFMYKLTF